MRDIIYFDENLSVEEYVKKKYVKMVELRVLP